MYLFWSLFELLHLLVLEIALALLKCRSSVIMCICYVFRYQFNPAQTDLAVVAKILLKALTQLPNPDFNLCLYLLNEQVVTSSLTTTR